MNGIDSVTIEDPAVPSFAKPMVGFQQLRDDLLQQTIRKYGANDQENKELYLTAG